MAILVTVLIPVYNAGAYLQETVASVLRQSIQTFELIVVDDGSTDGCLAPVEDLRDPRIRIIRQSNEGAPAAMNRALALARGEFVALLDHDDIWAERKLEAQLQHFEAHPEADVTFSWSRWIDSNGRDLEIEPRCWRGAISFEELVEDFVIGNTSAIMARRDVLTKVGGFDETLGRAYDHDLVLRIALLRPGNVQATPEVLTHYRRHQAQMSRHWQEALPEWERLMDRVKGYMPSISQRTLVIGGSNMQRYFAWLAYEEKEYWQACRFIVSAFRRSPLRAASDRRNWMLGGAAVVGVLLPQNMHRKLETMVKRLLSRPMPNLEAVVPWVAPAMLILLWQLATAFGLVNPLLVPSPGDLLRAAQRLTDSGELPLHLAATLKRVGLGMAAGCTAGLVAGTVLGMTGFARRLLEPLLLTLGSVPKVTLLPLVMLLLGINETSRTVPVAASCFVIIALHALDAVRGIEGRLVQLAKHYGAGPTDLFYSVYLPSILPSIFTGLRVATGTCLVVTISTELLGAPAGLGHLIWSSYQTFAVDKLYLGIVLSASLGLTMQWTVNALRRKIVPWKMMAD